MYKYTILLLLLTSGLQAQRMRHVPIEWNAQSICLEQNFMQLANAGGWHVSPWLGVYFQTPQWWIYHCEKGWMYPESDTSQGVWFYWQKTGSWIWTRQDVYPFAWDNFTENWINFCLKPDENAL